MKKDKEQIAEIINLIKRIENKSCRHKFGNLFDIFEVTGKIALEEGFLKSYDAGAIINSLRKKFNLTTEKRAFIQSDNFDGLIFLDYAREKAKNKFEFYTGTKPINDEIAIIELTLPEGYTERLEKFMNACGWYMAYSEPSGIKRGCNLNIFEKRFQSTEGVKAKSSKFLYHLAPMSRISKILKIGLCPKSGCKMGFHPDRVYLFTEEPSDYEMANWISQLSATEKKETISKGYGLLKIDTAKIPDIEFYGDPNLDGAVYTRENINPSAITLIKR